MTEQDKKMLIKAIGCYMQHGLKCDVTVDGVHCIGDVVGVKTYGMVEINRFRCKSVVENVKPYLRPMSSITRDELDHIKTFFQSGLDTLDEFADYINWLEENKFDYKDLIGLGMALPAPDDMYR